MNKKARLALDAYLFYAWQEATSYGQAQREAKRVADAFYRAYMLFASAGAESE